MAAALIRLYVLLYLLGGSVQEGWAPRYSPGVMERVSRNRDLPIVSCMVSSPTLAVGSWVYIWGRNTHTLRYCRITDVSGPKDKARHIRTKRVAELSYDAALSLCGKAAMKKRPESCPIIIIQVNE
jgi:hypothetical protein